MATMMMIVQGSVTIDMIAHGTLVLNTVKLTIVSRHVLSLATHAWLNGLTKTCIKTTLGDVVILSITSTKKKMAPMVVH
jgi:hypothetical protein